MRKIKVLMLFNLLFISLFIYNVNSYAVKTEKEFTFQAQDKQNIKVSVASTQGKFRKNAYMAYLEPWMKKTDGNLYAISLELLHRFYGKHRGLIHLKDARIEHDAQGKGIIIWDVANPKQKFCVFPIKDTETQKIAAVVFWIE